MKLPKRIYVVAAVLLFMGGAGTVLALQSNSTPKEVTIKQVAATNNPTLGTDLAVQPAGEQTTVGQQTTTQQTVIQPDPVTVTAYEQIPIQDSEDIDCKLTYSDGTTYQWHWTTVNEHETWMTDSSGHNGHWVKATHTSNYCDASVIGNVKS